MIVVLLGALAGWFAGDWIAQSAAEDLRWIVGGASILALGLAFAKDWMLAVVDVVRHYWSGAGSEGALGRALATVGVVSFLLSTAVVVFHHSLLDPPKLESCEELVQALRDKDAVNSKTSVPQDVVARCLLDASDRVGRTVAHLVAATAELDEAAARVGARVAPCPLLFENAGLDEGRASLNGVDVCPTPAHMRRLRLAAAYLAEHCDAGDLCMLGRVNTCRQEGTLYPFKSITYGVPSAAFEFADWIDRSSRIPLNLLGMQWQRQRVV